MNGLPSEEEHCQDPQNQDKNQHPCSTQRWYITQAIDIDILIYEKIVRAAGIVANNRDDDCRAR